MDTQVRQVNLYEAKTQLSRLIRAALEGEEVVIARAGKPVVRLVPVQETEPRTSGWGLLPVDPQALDAAFAPEAEEEVAALFERRAEQS